MKKNLFIISFFFILGCIKETTTIPTSPVSPKLGKYKCDCFQKNIYTQIGGAKPLYDSSYYFNYEEVTSLNDSTFSISTYSDSFKTFNYSINCLFLKSDSFFRLPITPISCRQGKFHSDSSSSYVFNIIGGGTSTIYSYNFYNCKKIKP